MLFAAAPTAKPAENAPKKEARVIPLDETQARVFHDVYTHPSVPAVIEFPEPWVGTPSCGDCVDLSGPPEALKNSDALFAVQLYPEQQYILIKPAQFSKAEGGRVDVKDFLTTLTVKLQSKLTVTLRIQYGTLEQADPRVVFTLPNRGKESQYVHEQIAKAKAELQADEAERISAGVRDEFLRSFIQPHQCAELSRHERNDDIVVEVNELCRFGEHVLVRFTVENRHRTDFNVGDVSVESGEGKDAERVEGAAFRMEGDAREVPWKTVRAGVVGFESSDKVANYELTISEDGGKGRKVRITGLSF
jgi:hypothetical protein